MIVLTKRMAIAAIVPQECHYKMMEKHAQRCSICALLRVIDVCQAHALTQTMDFDAIVRAVLLLLSKIKGKNKLSHGDDVDGLLINFRFS